MNEVSWLGCPRQLEVAVSSRLEVVPRPGSEPSGRSGHPLPKCSPGRVLLSPWTSSIDHFGILYGFPDRKLDVSPFFTYLPLVPGPPKQSAASKLVQDGVPFEEALKKLESIVEAMEASELPLEKMLAHYEEGMRLGQVCQSKLAEAELKIQQLEKNAAGELAMRPISASGSEDE